MREEQGVIFLLHDLRMRVQYPGRELGQAMWPGRIHNRLSKHDSEDATHHHSMPEGYQSTKPADVYQAYAISTV